MDFQKMEHNVELDITLDIKKMSTSKDAHFLLVSKFFKKQ